MTTAGIIVIMLIAAIVFTFLSVVSTIRYRISEVAVEVLILGTTVRRIPLGDILEVHRRGAFFRESWSGPKFWNAVTLRRRRGLLKNFVISPEDPDRFVERLREAIRLAESRSLA